MFALEITFSDPKVKSEVLLIRRPQALIGAHDFAHVSIEDLKHVPYQLKIVRELGRRFLVLPVGIDENCDEAKKFQGTWEKSASFELGPVTLTIIALDIDLTLREDEEPDKAGIRILRRGVSGPSPLFPAAVARGAPSTVVSFAPEQPILIGRSRQCPLRLDASDISAAHARLGYESGEFWVEDLGSTNGTFVDDHQISGRMRISPGQSVTLGREIVITAVTNEEQLSMLGVDTPHSSAPRINAEKKYPAVVSTSGVARPARISLVAGSTVSIGRDNSCDMWIGAPHVSRHHCSVMLRNSGIVAVTDNSTNGTQHTTGLLRKGEILQVFGEPKLFDLGGDISIGICFTPQDEEDIMKGNKLSEKFRSSTSVGASNIASQMEESNGRVLTPVQDEIETQATTTMAKKVVKSSVLLGLLTSVVLVILIVISLVRGFLVR